MSDQQPLLDHEIDKLLAANGLFIPDELRQNVHEACRGLKALAVSLRKVPPK